MNFETPNHTTNPMRSIHHAACEVLRSLQTKLFQQNHCRSALHFLRMLQNRSLHRNNNEIKTSANHIERLRMKIASTKTRTHKALPIEKSPRDCTLTGS